ncbi:hypothetical protein, partial [Metapseudomonas otitidis]|uniref:hypothetical protein n=1 Tax=Metapseudomonas otitidis TaxID=319939 RepID=UPI00198170A6
GVSGESFSSSLVPIIRLPIFDVNTFMFTSAKYFPASMPGPGTLRAIRAKRLGVRALQLRSS